MIQSIRVWVLSMSLCVLMGSLCPSAHAVVLPNKCIQKSVRQGVFVFKTHGTVEDSKGYSRAAKTQKKRCLQGVRYGVVTRWTWKPIQRSVYRLYKRDWFKIRSTCHVQHMVCKTVSGDFTLTLSDRSKAKLCSPTSKTYRTCIQRAIQKRFRKQIRKECHNTFRRKPLHVRIQRKEHWTLHFASTTQKVGRSQPTTLRIRQLHKVRALYTCLY